MLPLKIGTKKATAVNVNNLFCKNFRQLNIARETFFHIGETDFEFEGFMKG